MASEAAMKAAWKIFRSTFDERQRVGNGSFVESIATIIDAAFAPLLAAKDAEIASAASTIDALTAELKGFEDLSLTQHEELLRLTAENERLKQYAAFTEKSVVTDVERLVSERDALRARVAELERQFEQYSIDGKYE